MKKKTLITNIFIRSIGFGSLVSDVKINIGLGFSFINKITICNKNVFGLFGKRILYKSVAYVKSNG